MTTNPSKHSRRILAGLFTTLMTATAAFGQILQEPALQESYRLRSDLQDNSSVQTQVAYVGSVQVAGASWIRLHVGAHELGKDSYMTFTSLLDGQVQRFDARSLPDWSHWSAIFNGDEVEIELHVAPGERGVFVEVDQVRASEPNNAEVDPDGQVATICNDFDDRGASNDARVGRMRIWNTTPPGGVNINGSCTAWLVSNGAVLSAGHCLRGGIPAGSLIEFNVPLSLANGTNVAAAVNNQYPIDVGSFLSEDSGLGADWMVFGVNANSNTGLRAHVAQGYFHMTKLTPNAGTTLRVTGFGLDNIPAGTGDSRCLNGANQGASCTINANCPGGQCVGTGCCDSDGDGSCESNCNATSQTQQSTTGPMDDLEGDIIEHDVDTMPANSGSPIFVDGSDYAFGIHTAGGCDDFLNGFDNHGTHLHHGALEAALQNFLGFNTVYVDWADVGLPSNGSIYEPRHTVSSAVAAVVDGGIIALVPGSYPRAAGNTFIAGADGKAMTFVAPAGAAVIGN